MAKYNRRKVMYATKEHINGELAVKNFLYQCIFNLDLGIGFHPDTNFNEYITSKNNKRVFTKSEAEELNNTLAECFEQCDKLKLDIYGLALEVCEPLLKQIGIGTDEQ